MIWHHIGKGEGRPLILLHGIGMNGEAWGPILDRLARQRRVIAMDIPGFGQTPPLEVVPTATALAVSLGQCLRAMGIDEPVDIAGNSLGGRIALEAAASGLARSVVGISPAGLWREKGPFHLEYMFGAMRKGYKLMPSVAERLLEYPVGRVLLLTGAVGARSWKMPAHEAQRAARLFAATEHFEPVFEALRPPFTRGAEIEVPCTIAFGDLDFVFPWGTRDRSRAPSHTNWVRLYGCGHVPMWDDPEQVSRVILNATA